MRKIFTRIPQLFVDEAAKLQQEIDGLTTVVYQAKDTVSAASVEKGKFYWVDVNGGHNPITNADTINEITSGSGVTIDSVLLKDGLVTSTGVKLSTALGTTPVATVSIAEFGDGRDITTVLTLTDFVVGALAGAGAALGLGNIVYAFPAGQHLELVYSFSSLSLKAAGTAVATDTGLGSVIATGAVSVLSGTATFENRLTGQTITTAPTGGTAVSALTATTAGIGTGIGLNVAASVKNVFLNSAGTWNVDNTGNLTATGTIVLKWTKM